MRNVFALLITIALTLSCAACEHAEPRPESYSEINYTQLIHEIELDVDKAADTYVGKCYQTFVYIDYISNDKESFTSTAKTSAKDFEIRIIGSVLDEEDQTAISGAIGKPIQIRGRITEITSNSNANIKINMDIYEIVLWYDYFS